MLTSRGERITSAFWISFIEMVLDTLVASSIAVAAGLYALNMDAQHIGMLILAVSMAQLLGACSFLAIAKGVGEQTVKNEIIKWLPITKWMRLKLPEISEDMRKIVSSTFSRTMLNTFTYLLLMTVILMTTPALVLYVMLNYSVGACFAGPLFAFHSGNILGVLPVTVGGAGLTEAGVYLYLNNVLGIDSAATVMRWRLATYYVSVIISGILFVLTMVNWRRGGKISSN